MNTNTHYSNTTKLSKLMEPINGHASISERPEIVAVHAAVLPLVVVGGLKNDCKRETNVSTGKYII